MIKFISTLLILFLVISSFAQNQNIESDNGYNIYYYPNNQISSEGNMIDGRPDGVWKSYFVDGTLKSIGIRKNGVLDSVWIFNNELGFIKNKINYLNGKKNGYFYTFKYFKNVNDSMVGYLYGQELYLNNKKNGISEYYYPNGILKSAVNYYDGSKHGTTREFNNKGVLIYIIEFWHGKVIDREVINQYNGNLKVGVWKEFYPNGKLKKEENYSDGILQGLVKLYDLRGELLSAYRYDNGILKDTSVNIESDVDIVEEFYNKRNEYGELIKKSSGGFLDGKPVGVHRTYDSLGRVNSSRIFDRDGNLIAKGIVNEEGDKLGEWIYYYAQGNIKSKGKYRNNRRVNNWNYYYLNGNVEQQGSFKKGVPDGLWKWYFESGQLKREEFYRLGEEEGESVEYDENGNIISVGSYLEGLKEGQWFYDFDFHTEKGIYKSGYKEGKWQYFYKNNVLYFEGKFVQGYEDGKHIYYHKNGKLKEVRFYSAGRKIKNWEYYDYYGSLIKILTFEDNKLIKIDGVSIETE